MSRLSVVLVTVGLILLGSSSVQSLGTPESDIPLPAHKKNDDKPNLLALSEEIIDYVNNAKTTWKAGKTNRFNSESEFKQLLGALPFQNNKILPIKRVLSESSMRTRLPRQFDARTKWPNCPTISQINDQADCGSCWAFSTTNSMSDRICIHTNGTSNPSISVADVLSCCGTMCGDGCEGGFAPMAWLYWQTYGISTGAAYGSHNNCKPYQFAPCNSIVNGHIHRCRKHVRTPSCNWECQAGYGTPYHQDLHRGETAYQVLGERSIMRELMENGPVQSQFMTYADFATYKSGVYHHVAGRSTGGHAVRIIGWGVEHGSKYWLIANTWTKNWGEDGLFKIRRGVNECGIEEEVYAGMPLINPDC